MGEAAFGALLQKGDGGDPVEAFVNVGEVKDISGPGFSQEIVDSTHHGSTGGWEEAVATILRSGEVTFTVNFDPVHATHDAATGLRADFVNRTLRNWKLVRSDAGATTDAFAAFVSGFEESNPVAGVREANVTLKLSGPPTLG